MTDVLTHEVLSKYWKSEEVGHAVLVLWGQRTLPEKYLSCFVVSWFTLYIFGEGQENAEVCVKVQQSFFGWKQ